MRFTYKVICEISNLQVFVMMENTLRSQQKYLPIKYMVSTAFVISFYINTFTQYLSLNELLQHNYYYEALLFSFLITFGILWAVEFISVKLDGKVSWEKQGFKRLAFQLLFGVGLILLLLYGAVRIYFKWVGGDIYLSDYMVVEFPIAQAMVLALNMLFVCLYFAKKFLESKSQEKHLQATLARKSFFVPIKDVAYLIREDKEGYVVLKNNKKLLISYKMAELEKLLDAEKFFRINRSVIVAIDVIAGYQPIKNGQCLLLLKVEVTTALNLQVTRERTKVLKHMAEERKLALIS